MVAALICSGGAVGVCGAPNEGAAPEPTFDGEKSRSVMRGEPSGPACQGPSVPLIWAPAVRLPDVVNSPNGLPLASTLAIWSAYSRSGVLALPSAVFKPKLM